LHVVDRRQEGGESGRHIALRGLAVVDVELQPEPVASDRGGDRRALLLGAQQVAGRVARVQWLYDQLDPGGEPFSPAQARLAA